MELEIIRDADIFLKIQNHLIKSFHFKALIYKIPFQSSYLQSIYCFMGVGINFFQVRITYIKIFLQLQILHISLQT